MKSPLRWVGGKSWLVERLNALYQRHRHRRFADIFVGGGSAVLGVEPVCALLCDKNPHLINFWQQLRNPTPFLLDMRNEEELFYAYRKCFNDLARTQARWTRTAAELFLYLNKTCFNGVCRFNKMGIFNVPFGKRKTVEFPRALPEYAEPLQRWEIFHFAFDAAPIYPEDFVFADPPYDGTFVDYSTGGFAWEDQVRLAKKLLAHPGPVVASNAATDRILELYRGFGFDVETLPAPRSVSANGDRQDAMEMLATRNI